MVFLTGKYYVCVGKYIIQEEEERQSTNGFLNTVSYRERNRYGGLYDDDDYQIDYQIRCPKELPHFTVGVTYRCSFSGRLIDDKNNVCNITSENEKNFVLLDFHIDPITNEFIKKVCRLHSITITVEPCKLIDYDQNVYDRFHDLSMFKLWFKTTLTYYGSTYYSMDLYEDKESIRKACYNIWKKVRVYSKQCKRIINSAHLKMQKLCQPRYTRWIDDWSDVSSLYFPF